MSEDLTLLRPRVTLHKGIRMRSRLEAGFARWCDERRIEWVYEPCALSGDGGQWLPDFVLPHALWLSDGELVEVPTFVEVKYEGWDIPAELARIYRVWETATADDLSGTLVLARPEGIESVLFGERLRLRLLPCDRPQGAVCFQYAAEVVDGPWLGDWWRR
jgi:hypothetical protein